MIRVYVQELATYNAAYGVGKWVEVSAFEDELVTLFEKATLVLKENNNHYGVDAEEYEIVDWECDIDINLDAIYTDIKALQALDELLENASEHDIKKIGYLLYEGYSIDQIDDEAFDGIVTYESWDEAIEDFIENYLDVPDNSAIHYYLDYSKIQRDLEIDRYVEYKGTIFMSYN
jgi:antirestriction protein